MAILLRKNVVATLAEFGDWEEKSGGVIEGNVVDHYQAGKDTPDKLSGTHMVTNLTLARGFDPERDAKVIDWVKKSLRTGKDNTRTCVVKYNNALGIPVRSETYGSCKPVSITPPDGKAGDNTPAMLTLVLAVEDNP